MGFLFTLSKCCIFSFNFICLALGIGSISANILGLDTSKAGSEEHTYFIVGIILGAFVCISCLFGCYGVLCELLSVSIVYTFFVLILFILQYLQMRSFQPQTYFNHAVEQLRNTWNQVEVKPLAMQAIEVKYHCCGYNNATDYDFLRLSKPSSCYQNNDATKAINLYERGCLDAIRKCYQFGTRREKLFNWALLGSEGILFVQSLLLSVLLYRRRYPPSPRPYIEPPQHNDDPAHWNNVHSRTNLLFE